MAIPILLQVWEEKKTRNWTQTQKKNYPMNKKKIGMIPTPKKTYLL
jgi:hypothetical protein